MTAVVMEVWRRMRVLSLIAIRGDSPLASMDKTIAQHQISNT